MPSSDSRYLLELDGFGPIAALDVTMPTKTHTPVEYQPGNVAEPELVRGNTKTEELTLKHAHGVGNVAENFARYFDDFIDGLRTDRLQGRFLVMDESGLVVQQTYEIQDAVPTQFKPEQHTGTGTGVSSFTIGLRPSRFRLL
ncbi:MAG: hypothetical protein ABW250_26770 [Pyrinomonadaceae bacterium]